MAKAMVECRVCKQKFNRLDPELLEDDYWVQPVKRFYYHKKCYEDFAKKRGQIGKEGIELEADELVWKTAVEDYLKRDLKISLDYKKFNSQWKKFIEKDGRTPKGIYFTIRYFYEVDGGLTSKSEGGIGIVSYKYEDAAAYWEERNQRDKNIVAAIEEQIRQAQSQNIINVHVKKVKREVKSAAEVLAEIMDMEDDE